MSGIDSVSRFLLERLDIRGVVVRLGPAWQAMQHGRGYPPLVAQVLGEMTAVSSILAGQLKAPGRLGFQLSGSGPIRRLVIDCDEALRLRGMASLSDTQSTASATTAADLLGHGQLAMTLELPELPQPFQSIVPLSGDSVAAIFEHYLAQSEQQAARLFLAATGDAAAGLFLQKMPAADERDADGWNRISCLAETVSAAELCELGAAQLLTRLFAEEDVRLFAPRQLSYHCPQDWDKVRAMLRSIGRAEVEATLAEHGEVVVHDDICNHSYRFDAAAIAELFDSARHLH